jgi:4'-phosphopantetheinyl transferase
LGKQQNRGNGDLSADIKVVELWCVDLESAANALEALEAETPRVAMDDEERISRRADEASRRQHRTAHIALRILIERAFGPGFRRTPYVRSENGKPALQAAPGTFSLSHTDGTALIALSPDGPVGVDVEHVRERKIDERRRSEIIKAARELGRSAPLPPDPENCFSQSWVRLEAVAKADGSGIGQLLTRAGVGRTAPESAHQSLTHEPFVAHDVAIGSGLVAAMALPRACTPPALTRFPNERDKIQALMERMTDRTR